MNQLTINFSAAPRARRSDPITSHKAAERAKGFAGGHAGRILLMLQSHGPRSAHALSLIVGLTVVQIDRRLPELKKLGLAMPTGDIDNGCRVWGVCH